MRRRLLKPLATMMGAAALVVAPVALLAPSAQADGHVLTPDDEVEGTSAANNVEYWEDTYLPGLTPPITNATCTKVPGTNEETWTIPAAPAGTEFVIVVTKAADENALPEGEKANWVFWFPEEGDVVPAVADKDISHVIWCTVPKTTTPPVTTPPVTGPPVETDRVADTGSAAGLGLALGATALVAGAGAMVVSRRRQGAHR
jgi:hypothetical protein